MARAHAGPRPRVAAHTVLLVTMLAVGLGGCTGAASTASDNSPAPQSPVAVEQPTVSASPSVDVHEAEVLERYNAYWPALVEASKLPVAQMKPYLDDYATGRSLERNYGGLVALQHRKRALYGSVVTRPEIISLTEDTATVRDCQDGTNNGQVDLRTGKKLTKGKERTLLEVTLRRGPDTVWRVATATYPGKPC